jgi:membrane-associated protease RseP (regulator of RpoE activity)
MLPILVYGIATAHPVPIPTGVDYYYSDDPLLLTWLSQWVGPAIPEGYTIFLSGPLMAAWVGCLVTAINLFPIGQLDGGHICYAISSLFHRRASLAGIAGFIALGLLLSPSWLFFAMLLLFFGPKHPPLIDESEPLSSGRRLVALLALIILLICFIPRPLSQVES